MGVDYSHMCPRYEKAAEFIGKKWTGLILRVLLDGPKHFSEFREQVPDLSDRVLSERLKELQQLGIVEREVHSTRPVTTEYSLTEKGKALRPVVEALQDWAERWCEP